MCGWDQNQIVFQHGLDDTHCASMRTISKMSPDIPPPKEDIKKIKNLFSQLIVICALDITTNCVCRSNFVPSIHFQQDRDGPNFTKNAGALNKFLLADGITAEKQLHNLKTLELTKENMKKYFLGVTGDYSYNVLALAKRMSLIN